MMVEFLSLQYRMGEVTPEQLQTLINADGKISITQEEYDSIIGSRT